MDGLPGSLGMNRVPETTEGKDRFTFGWEPLRDLLADPNVRSLILDYWEELSPLKRIAPLDPDWARLAMLEENGLYRVWAARDGALLIGFIGFHLLPHLNYRTTMFAIDGGHYLDTVYRSEPWLGFKMWRAALAGLAALQVKVVVAHDNAAHPLGPFFKRLGFAERSMTYWKAL